MLQLRPCLTYICAILALGAAPRLVAQAPSQDSIEKDLLELLNTPIVSASKSAEKLSEAPATVIVISREDIEKRGYTELSQVLDDLPGMDMARSYGANYFKDYWRGYRNDIGEPFLVMVDGVTFNHLWYNTADTPMVTYPLAAVERVEVVYGPASSVYGANAFMGVINILTRKATADGFKIRGTATGGSLDSRITDVQASFKSGDLSFSLALRSDKGNMDEDAAERYEYTRRAYYNNPLIWGNLIGTGIGGGPESRHQHTALDARVQWGKTEFGYQQLVINSGYGTAYAADQSQSVGTWSRPEYSFFVRRTDDLSSKVSLTSLARYRRSDTGNDSWDLESNYSWGVANAGGWILTTYHCVNSSVALYEDFEVRVTDGFTINTGAKYESKDLQQAYDSIYLYPGDKLEVPHSRLYDSNHFNTEERGIYAQGRYKFNSSNQVNLGIRSDYNSIYRSATTVRGGYVGNFGPWGVKAMYGQAYQEPTARLLYGATSGTGANPNLKPERSNTAEISGSYTDRAFGVNLSLWQVHNTGKIQNVVLSGGGTTVKRVLNWGDQKVTGMDLGVQWLIPTSFARQWKVWGYYSHYFKSDDIRTASSFEINNTMVYYPELTTPSGDLSKNKFWLGTTLTLNSHFNGTLLARYIGARDTVLSNPVGKVDGYTTLDLTVNFNDILVKGLGASLRVANLLDKGYMHPGLRDASAGTTPGYVDLSGNYVGSRSYYNSLLPQPGRQIQVSVRVDF